MVVCGHALLSVTKVHATESMLQDLSSTPTSFNRLCWSPYNEIYENLFVISIGLINKMKI